METSVNEHSRYEADTTQAMPSAPKRSEVVEDILPSKIDRTHRLDQTHGTVGGAYIVDGQSSSRSPAPLVIKG